MATLNSSDGQSANHAPTTPIMNLPVELQLIIVDELGSLTRSRLSQTCSHFRSIIKPINSSTIFRVEHIHKRWINKSITPNIMPSEFCPETDPSKFAIYGFCHYCEEFKGIRYGWNDDAVVSEITEDMCDQCHTHWICAPCGFRKRPTMPVRNDESNIQPRKNKASRDEQMFGVLANSHGDSFHEQPRKTRRRRRCRKKSRT